MIRGCSMVVAMLLVAASAQARPPHKQSLKRHYGDLLAPKLFACTTCHLTREQAPDPATFDAEFPPHNAFGIRLNELGNQLEQASQPNDMQTRLRTVAAEDADGDGVSNEVEILAGCFPGNAHDKPTAEDLAAAAETIRKFTAKQAGYCWEPFRPVVGPAVPTTHRAGWVRNPIDAFIAVEHEARGLSPRPDAAKHVLLRRVYIDLTGLPPTRDELLAFFGDTSVDAYERVVDQLLASPRYGERWGRHWMDVWRYSDWAGWTDGKQIRDSQPHIWRWRDWIVESLNSDCGYDLMVSDMLAADELHSGDPGALRATGYLARNYKMLSRETWMQDTVLHTAQAFLGVTLGCARCHDHMYDLVDQDEYYRFRAIFEPHNVRLDRIPGQPDTAQNGLARVFDAEPAAVTYLFERGDDRKPDKEHPLQPGVPRVFGSIEFKVEPVPLPAMAYYPGLTPHVQQETLAAAESDAVNARSALDTAANALAQAQQAVPPTPDIVTQAASASVLAEKSLAAARANVAFVQVRTAADNAKYAVTPAADANELSLAAGKAERELAFCNAEIAVLKAEQALAAANAALKPNDEPSKQAVANAEKALTDSRAVLNSADKARAEPAASYSSLGPVYPATSTGRRTALARWITNRRNPLAARVAVNHIWLRHFGKPLVASTFDFGANGQPPTHPALIDWLAAELMGPSTAPPAGAWSMKHLHRLIVTSATYRMASTPDAANLALDPDNRYFWRAPSRRMEAEAVRDGVLHVCGQLDPAMCGADIDYQQGLSVKRRSIYFRHAQEKQMEFLKMFDCAAVTECYERKESVIPQQALALANSELSLVQARLLARKLAAECGGDPAAFVAACFEVVLARPASAVEEQTCLEFIDRQTRYFAANTQRVAATAGDAADPGKPSAEPALRARENLIHALLNHNDFVTIR
ncbi:MAG TPA: DUF1549 and DUF1553 domain-containing protein [Pirellulales bacterium]|nr:DUF1549 and DUF1553 domain-containing protein [Pirellulales bacterium]